jgi:hypothetical protein
MMTVDVFSRLSATQVLGATISLAVIVLSAAVIVTTFISGWRDNRPSQQ